MEQDLRGACHPSYQTSPTHRCEMDVTTAVAVPHRIIPARHTASVQPAVQLSSSLEAYSSCRAVRAERLEGRGPENWFVDRSLDAEERQEEETNPSVYLPGRFCPASLPCLSLSYPLFRLSLLSPSFSLSSIFVSLSLSHSLSLSLSVSLTSSFTAKADNALQCHNQGDKFYRQPINGKAPE